MRALVLALLLLGACGEPPRPRAPPDVLARMNPNADTSHNPTLKTYGSPWAIFHPDSSSYERWAGDAPHYYTGCGGCSSNDAANAFALLAAIPLLARRRRA